jgi:phenylacetate-CoA ligase
MALNLSRNARRLMRSAILAYGRRIPQDRMLSSSARSALHAARRAAKSSSAYRILLGEMGLAAASLAHPLPLTALPELDKSNTFARFPLQALADGLDPRALGDVLTSSGQGGQIFGLKLANRSTHDKAWFDIDLGLQDAFNVDARPTLLVNCLPMGVVFRSRAVTVANVSVREDMACAILRELAPLYAQTVVCTDPLFAVRLLDEASRKGVDWSGLKASMILGEEVMVESQREYFAARMGIDLNVATDRLIASSFGVAELGLNLMFESRESIRLGRAMRQRRELAQWLTGPSTESWPSLFCFNPLRCHIEVLRPDEFGFGELCFTMLKGDAVIPLPRYLTGDVGRLLSESAVRQAAEVARCAVPWLPMVALRGKGSDRARGLPSVEQVKDALYSHTESAMGVTGAFRLHTDANGIGRLLVQCKADPPGEGFRAAVAQAVDDRLAAFRLDVRVEGREAFTDRPPLDYERKFRYFELTSLPP